MERYRIQSRDVIIAIVFLLVGCLIGYTLGILFILNWMADKVNDLTLINKDRLLEILQRYLQSGR